MAKNAIQKNESTDVLPTAENIPGLYFATPEKRAAAMNTGKVARQIVTLSPGQVIEGVYLGVGAPVDCKTPDGEMGSVKTHNFDMGQGITVGILGSHTLDSELPAYVGRKLYVEKGETKKVGSRQVNQWLIIDRDAAPNASA